MKIRNFKEVRRDGIVIDQSVTIDDLIAMSGTPDERKIIEIRWEFNGKNFSYSNKNGLSSILAIGGNYIAVVTSTGGQNHDSLLIIGANGIIEHMLSNCINVDGVCVFGNFRWFEKPTYISENIFSIIFEFGDWYRYFRSLHINAETGEIVKVQEAR